MIIEENRDPQLNQLEEMFVNVMPSLPASVENSIFYPKLKALLFNEIIYFCKEKAELKEDLNILRLSIGEYIDSNFIKEYLDGLKEKYNTTDNNIGIEYHMEMTRIDYSATVFVIIKRDEIYSKKFVFRFRRAASQNLNSVKVSGMLTPFDAETKEAANAELRRKENVLSVLKNLK